jgi:hypothetical protein
MFFQSEFFKLYEELSEINLEEAKSKTLEQAIKENCDPISTVLPNIPDKISGHEIYVSKRFKREYNDFSKAHRDIIEKINEKLRIALCGMTNGVPDAPVDNIATSVSKMFKELKIGRFKNRQEVRAIYFIEEDNTTGQNFFILGSLFVHADTKLIKGERESAIGTYKNIQNSM